MRFESKVDDGGCGPETKLSGEGAMMALKFETSNSWKKRIHKHYLSENANIIILIRYVNGTWLQHGLNRNQPLTSWTFTKSIKWGVVFQRISRYKVVIHAPFYLSNINFETYGLFIFNPWVLYLAVAFYFIQPTTSRSCFLVVC
jgi:hypothetical protein